jgi:cytochrome c-type biogenesis protein
LSLDAAGLAFAFTAGLLSIFSPCGYALLPGYISYYLGSDLSIARGFYGGLTCTLGLMTVFSVVGAFASGLGALLHTLVPLLDLLAAAILILMGAIMLMEIQLPYISINMGPSRRRGLPGFYLFGIVYGMAGVGCSAPIFLSVLLHAMTRGPVNGLLTFAIYAIGMGTPLIVTSVLLAEAKDYVIARITRITPKLHRLSGVILILVGVYLAYFYFITY